MVADGRNCLPYALQENQGVAVYGLEEKQDVYVYFWLRKVREHVFC